MRAPAIDLRGALSLVLVTAALRTAAADVPAIASEPDPAPAPAPAVPAVTQAAPTAPRRNAKLLAAGSVALVHAAYATWSYFAWYRDANTEDFHLERSPWFAVDAYAGGADKLGHLWSNYVLTRATTEVLVAGGWRRRPSSLVAAGLTEVAFLLTELQDGFVWGFDPKDMIANGLGAALALVMDNVPALDRLVDFRLQYVPSRDYRRHFADTGSVDIGQDYTGQSYLVALHLGALPGLPDRDWGYWARFLDVAVGFEARHYTFAPEVRTVAPKQTLYAGLALDLQSVLAHLFADSRARRVGRGIFEVYSPPLTTFRYVEASRRAD